MSGDTLVHTGWLYVALYIEYESRDAARDDVCKGYVRFPLRGRVEVEDLEVEVEGKGERKHVEM